MDEKKPTTTTLEFTVPEVTPEIAKQLAKESEAIRAEFRPRIEKMWDISLEERQKLCKVGSCPSRST